MKSYQKIMTELRHFLNKRAKAERFILEKRKTYDRFAALLISFR